MNQKQTKYEQLAWTAFLARVFGETGPSAYMSLFSDNTFRRKLVFEPKKVSVGDIQSKLISGFLNKWRSRFPNNEKSGSAILETIKLLSPSLQALDKYEIGSVNFEENIVTNNGKGTIYECIVYIFEKVSNSYGFITTVGAKILGILNPNLFVMWDNDIAYRYGLTLFQDKPGHIYSGEGYAAFLKEMQSMAREIILDFQHKFGTGDPATYLSGKLGVLPSVPLAKLLDEYNWVTITNKIDVPPKWHPCDDM